MCKKTVKIIAIIVLMSMLLNTTALAIDSKANASAHLSRYGAAFVSTSSSGIVNIRFNVTGTGSMNLIGAISIRLYDATDGYYERTYSSAFYDDMLVEDTNCHSSYVLHIGKPGHTYYAVVKFFARNGNGCDTVEYMTNIG